VKKIRHGLIGSEVKIGNMETVKWSEEEFETNYTREWERSVEITYWEHDVENGWYIIKFKKK
jgi:hypothetical protein